MLDKDLDGSACGAHQRIFNAGSDGNLAQQVEPAGDPAGQRAVPARETAAPEVQATGCGVCCTRARPISRRGMPPQ